MQLIRNRYFIGYLLIYCISVFVLHFIFHQPFPDSLSVFFIVGVAFSSIAWLLVKDKQASPPDKPVFKNEGWVVAGLILFFVFYVTYGTGLINKIIPLNIISVAWKNSILVLVKKLLVFVVIPFFIYKGFGFSIRDFGFYNNRKEIFNRKTILVFVILSAAILLFQYFLSGGARPLREGQFNSKQLLLGLPLLYAWLFLEVGLVEEFFFRAVLQSRIAMLLKSPVAGILVSGLIFGLAHAPGLYLRGAESEGLSESLPFGFWMAYTISAMSVAGIFLGIVWSRTKNIWLVMALHAMTDLLPNAPELFQTWNV